MGLFRRNVWDFAKPQINVIKKIDSENLFSLQFLKTFLKTSKLNNSVFTFKVFLFKTIFN